MAKINHHNFNDTIQDLLTEAKSRGVIQLKYESDSWEGSKMLVGSKEMKNFGTCGYLGLEMNPKIIEQSIQFTQKFGTQFSVSRTYLTARKSIYLEELLSEIFCQKKIISFTSTTMLHTSVLPCVVGSKDVVILDQQCHASIQTAAQLLSSKGVPIDMIRHSNLEMLEHKIKNLRDRHERIWYMIDGVYSMFGDVAPISEINELMNKYPQLHLYVDDAHGMSWHGINGCGRIFKECLDNERTIYITTMAKGFGTMGGIAVFPNESWYEKVIIYGGALTHSHPIPPPMLGASIASAKIHLSGEIYDLQATLQEKLAYANELFQATDLPMISNPRTPIFFLGTGQPSVGYKLNKRILDEGFYVNIGMFPAVPIKNTGLRFTITNHNTKLDIKSLVEVLNYHYPLALEEDSKTKNDVRKAFHLPLLDLEEKNLTTRSDFENFSIEVKKTIHELEKKEWDECFEKEGNYDYDSMILLENAFKGNSEPFENWNFHYLMIRNQMNEIVLATFFTSGIFKDDMLSEADVSRQIEEKRRENPLFLSSKSLMMGSLFTEGNHLFLDKNQATWRLAVEKMLLFVTEVQEKEEINTLIFRDFSENELDLDTLFHDAGYFKVNMPNSNIIDNLPEKKEDFFQSLSVRSRRHIKNDVLNFESHFQLDISDRIEEQELEKAYKLFSNVSKKNTGINIYKYPFKLFSEINKSEDWEFIKLYLNKNLVAIGFCHKGKGVYNPILVGLDYDLNFEYNCYKQMLYRVCLRAIDLGYKKIHFGFSADIEKKKLGAKQVNKFAYLQAKDQFNLELIEKYNKLQI